MADQEILDCIPHRPPFLFVDKAIAMKENGIVCSRKFDGNEDFYRGHYPNAPLTPGVLLCESVFQTASVYLVKKAQAAGTAGFENRTPVLCRVENAKFKSMVFPGDEITIEVSEGDQLSGFFHMSGMVKTERGVALQIKFAITMLEKK